MQVYYEIHGTTDSEHLFALYIEFYKQMKSKYSKDKRLELMADVLCKVITTVLDLGSELKKKVKKILVSFPPSYFLDLVTLLSSSYFFVFFYIVLFN